MDAGSIAPEGVQAESIEDSATKVFLALMPKTCVSVLKNRQSMCRRILGIDGKQDWQVLPIPPDLDIPGVIGYTRPENKSTWCCDVSIYMRLPTT